MNGSRFHRRGLWCAAFTLVELLVVIGIIAVLIGVLLPALNKARQQSRMVACLANLRTLGQAITMYNTDNKWMIPAAYWGKKGSNGVTTMNNKPCSTWANILVDAKYIPRPRETFANPKNPAAGIIDGPMTNTPFFCPDGIFEWTLTNLSPTSPTDASGAIAFRTQSTVPPYTVVDCWYGINAATQLSGDPTIADATTLPARTWPYDDAGGGQPDPVANPERYQMLRPTLVRKASEVVLLFDGIFMNPSVGTIAPALGSYRINARHNRQRFTNLLFCDGHAASVMRNQLPLLPTDFSLKQLALPQYSTVKWRIDQ